MKIEILRTNPKLYSSRVYHVRGDWNALSDVNTLIDVGTDGYILDHIKTISTGVGKKRVEQVILTHEHFDHAAGLKFIKAEYSPVVYSFARMPLTDVLIEDGMELTVGNEKAILLHTPGHSHDSVCIYCKESKVLFAGDTAINIKTPGGSYPKDYVEALEKLNSLDIETIYAGHDDPFIKGVKEMLSTTLANVKASKIID
jgi:glyoxylase-like metal-dependent hydrolase (beta-lactamase superfamily II)